MRSYPLFGFIFAVTSAALLIGCTTKFKDPEDGDTDSIPDSLTDTDSPLEGTDPLPDGQDVPADGDEEDDGEPGRRIVLEQGTAVQRPLGNEQFYSCGFEDENNNTSNLRTLISAGLLYVVTSYEDQTVPGDEYDCVRATSYGLPTLAEDDTGEICNEAGTNILADSGIPPSIFEDNAHIYLFEAVHDRSGGDEDGGNARGYRLEKDNLGAAAIGYVFTSPLPTPERPPFSEIHARLCRDQAHVIVRTGQSSPGVPGDHYGFTLANDSENQELDRMFNEGATREFEEAGHFISTIDDPVRDIFILGAECRDRSLMLAAQEFMPDSTIEALVINFTTDLIRAGSHSWSEITICTSDSCSEDDEPAIEGITMIVLDRPPATAMDKLFAGWISNPEPFIMLDLPASHLHAGGILVGTSIYSDYQSPPVTAPDDPDRVYQPFPPTFQCSSFKPQYFKALYDSERDVLFVTGVFYDRISDGTDREALVNIHALDGNLRELAPPFYLRTGLPLMLNYEAALDEGSGTLYFTWALYEPSAVDLGEETVNAAMTNILITPVTYHDAD